MYCPNCKQEYDGKFCPECGTKLIERPATSGVSLSLGDANAISGGLHVNDSHAVHNEDKSVHNITNTTSTVNNITQVSAQKTELELFQEHKTQFLNACKRAYEDNVLNQKEIIELQELRIKLGLDEKTAEKILVEVKAWSDRNAVKSELPRVAKVKLKSLTDKLLKNEVKALMDQIDSLEPLVKKYDHDELSHKYYLVLAALKPEKCIEQKERTKTDTYWETFWSCLAYIKAGRLIDAEDTLASLDRFTSYPEDNMTVLAAAGALMMGHNGEAKDYLDAATGKHTPALQRFVDSLYLLLAPQKAKKTGADENTCAFYLVNFFGQKDPKTKAEEERIRKAKAEEEAKRKAEEEAKRKSKEAEEALRKEVAERRRAEEKKKREAEISFEQGEKLYKEEEYEEAAKWYRKAAEDGHVAAQYMLGLCYEGIDQYRHEAKYWMRKAAEQGYAAAQNQLGDWYSSGLGGLTQNDAEAVKWYKLAASQDDSQAQYNLAESYYKARGVALDYAKAAEWYQKAAEQGNRSAQYALARCYYEGKGLSQDYSKAVRWYQKFVEQRKGFLLGKIRGYYKTAYYHLGLCYYHGNGVSKDQEKAVEFLKKSADMGYAEAQRKLEDIKEAEEEKSRKGKETAERRRKEEENRRRAAEAERKAKEEANRKAKEAEKTKLRAESKRQDSTIWPKVQSNESIDLPIFGLVFSWGLPIAVVLGGWIWSLFDDDIHGLGFYLSMFLLTAIITNFAAARDKDLHKGQRKYFVIPLIIFILFSGICILLWIRSLENQPSTKETYTYINDKFLVKNVFIVEINDGDTLLTLKNQGLCELVDDHLYERIKPKYDSIGYFAQSTNDVEMFIIKQDGKYGLVDKEDEELVEPKYTRIEMSDEDLKTQDGIKLFKAYTDNTVDVYSYEPRYYGQLQDK